MSSETLSPIEKAKRIDTLVRETPEIAGFQAYEYFRSDSAERREGFIEGETEELRLNYPRLESRDVSSVMTSAQSALRAMMAGDDNDKSRSLYNAIEYRYSEMFLVGLASEIQALPISTGEDTSRKEALEWFRDTNEALYGKPQKHVFDKLASDNISSVLEKEYASGELMAIRDELRSLVGRIDESDYVPYRPTDETILRAQALVTERFEQYLLHIDSDQTYDVEGMQMMLDVVLEKLDGKSARWHTEIVPNSSALTVSAHNRTVEIGSNRDAISGAVLRQKALHEVGVHALRSIIAEKAEWLSAAYGLEGYLPFEEALATALEDAYRGRFVDHGIDYYLIAGLAYGLDTHEERDFKEVYEIMWRLRALRDDKLSSDDSKVLEHKRKAFNSCMRLFRGTSAQDKGVVYLKDLAYFSGQELVWPILDTVHDQSDFDLLFCGKTDLSRPEHRKVAQEILRTQQV